MARLPGGRFVISQGDGIVTLWEDGSEREIARFDPASAEDARRAQETFSGSPLLNDEEKAFAHFWSGYFAGYAGHEGPGGEALVQLHNGQVIVRNDRGTEFTRFSPDDANAAALAQKIIYDESKLGEEYKPAAHFWCGYFYARHG